MKEKARSGEPDKVFVLRFWGDPGSQPATWRGEVKELGASRHSDRPFKVSGLAAACKVIAEQLRKSIMRE
ncbi:hypothetical protein [Mesorhizobium silamurunense]|uniref:hypothetical protein n=1 Tax=Mesorhizobium silamurunense TaxID=499528 RepID=UPI0017834F68|nr:hypothetical protein [Mesorhizobium silamurunense]